MAEYEYTIGEDEYAGYLVKIENLTAGVNIQKTFFLKQLFANANLSEEVIPEKEIKNVVVRIIWTTHREDGLKLPHDKGDELITMLIARHKKNKRTCSYDLVAV